MDQIFFAFQAWPALAAIMALATTVFAAGTITAILTQLMKLPFIPVYASKYPRVTAIVFSILTSLVATFVANVVVIVDWASFLVFAAVTAVLSFKIYDQTKAIVQEVKQAHDQKPQA